MTTFHSRQIVCTAALLLAAYNRTGTLPVHCSLLQESRASLPNGKPPVHVHQNGLYLRGLVARTTLGCLTKRREFAAKLPAVEPPEVFGLRSNAALANQRSEARRMLATLAAMQPRSAGLSGGLASDAVLLKQVCRPCMPVRRQLSMVACSPDGARGPN